MSPAYMHEVLRAVAGAVQQVRRSEAVEEAESSATLPCMDVQKLRIVSCPLEAKCYLCVVVILCQ